MPITPADLETWLPGRDLASLEGVENLRLRFVTFLARRYPEILSGYLNSLEGQGPSEREAALMDALAQVTRSGLNGTLPPPQLYKVLSEWGQDDEDAYELLNQLRPE